MADSIRPVISLGMCMHFASFGVLTLFTLAFNPFAFADAKRKPEENFLSVADSIVFLLR